MQWTGAKHYGSNWQVQKAGHLSALTSSATDVSSESGVRGAQGGAEISWMVKCCREDGVGRMRIRRKKVLEV